MKSKILKAAKMLLRRRIKAAGDWVYYARPSTCLYGPHGSVSFWSSSWDLEAVCQAVGEKFEQYLEPGFAGQVLAKARDLGARHERFVESVIQWRPTGQRFHYSDATEEIYRNRFGGEKRVTVTCHSDVP